MYVYDAAYVDGLEVVSYDLNIAIKEKKGMCV
jgi:hypothetical protein